MNVLRKESDFIRLLCCKLCVVLDQAAESGAVVEMDKLFGQLTIDVICEIAFQFDINAIENSALLNKLT